MNIKPHIAAIYLISMMLSPLQVNAQTGALSSMESSETISRRPLEHTLKGGYVVFETTKNAPASHTKSELDGRHVTYFFGYRHQVGDDYLMGLGLNHKSFTKKNDPDHSELSFLTIQHEAYRISRIGTNLYLLAGPKILYLMPLKQSFFPIDRDTDFETEIGVGFALMLHQKLGDDFAVTARIDRWRGTRTNLFHAFESSIGLTKKL